MHISARIALIVTLATASIVAVGAPATAEEPTPTAYTTSPTCVSYSQGPLSQSAASAIIRTLPKFDASQGALQKVTITGSVTGNGTASFENISTTPAAIFNWSLGAKTSISAPGFPVALQISAVSDPNAAAKGAYDNNLDYNGSSGGTSTQGRTSAVGPASLTDRQLIASYAGTGTFTVGLSSIGSSSLTSNLPDANWAGSATSSVTGQVCVTYGYIATSRIEGVDRYSTGVEISKVGFPLGNVDVVYVATGANYPDALSAGPVAVEAGGPLLLTPADSLPLTVKNEIVRLSPDHIVVIGGTGTVSANVYNQLSALQSSIERISGVNRYDTSRQVINSVFGAAPVLYVATGRNFPDALSAGGAAGAEGVPVLLVDGQAAFLDDVTLALIDSLSPDEIKIIGSDAAVSGGIATQLAFHTGTLTRIGGVDRFVVSRAVNTDAFTAADQAFIATGFNFPDALAGSALAGKVGAPLYVVPGTCVPSGVIDDLNTLGVEDVTILGGTGSVGQPVDSLTAC